MSFDGKVEQSEDGDYRMNCMRCGQLHVVTVDSSQVNRKFTDAQFETACELLARLTDVAITHTQVLDLQDDAREFMWSVKL